MLQIVIAVAVVCKNAVTHDYDDVHPDPEADVRRKGKRIHRPKFDTCIQILTIGSLILNLAVNAFFTARELKADQVTAPAPTGTS